MGLHTELSGNQVAPQRGGEGRAAEALCPATKSSAWKPRRMLLEGHLSHHSSRGSSQKWQGIFLEGRQAVLPMALLSRSPSPDRGQSPEREPPATKCPVPVHEDPGCARPCSLSFNPLTSPGGSALMVTHALQMQHLEAQARCLFAQQSQDSNLGLPACLSVCLSMELGRPCKLPSWPLYPGVKASALSR